MRPWKRRGPCNCRAGVLYSFQAIGATIDGNPANNEIDNLLLLENSSAHLALHNRLQRDGNKLGGRLNHDRDDPGDED